MGERCNLRILNAIHLACFVQLSQYNEVTFISADRKLCEVGYSVVNPEIDIREIYKGEK